MAIAEPKVSACKVAIFDLDGTLLTNDSFKDFLVYFAVRTPQRWWRLPQVFYNIFACYGLKRFDNSQLKANVVQLLFSGLPKQRTDPFCRQFLKKRLQPKLDPTICASLRQYHQSGVTVVLATASPSIYVHLLTELLPLSTIIATDMDISATGQWTGTLRNGNCYGQRKFAAVDQWLAIKGLRWDQCVMYSDHHTDLPLLQAAAQGYAVRPTERLKQQMATHNILEVGIND